MATYDVDSIEVTEYRVADIENKGYHFIDLIRAIEKIEELKADKRFASIEVLKKHRLKLGELRQIVDDLRREK